MIVIFRFAWLKYQQANIPLQNENTCFTYQRQGFPSSLLTTDTVYCKVFELSIALSSVSYCVNFQRV